MQFRPVMLAAMECMSPETVEKVLRMLTVISFRYTVVSALSTGNLEKVYSDCAIAIRKNKARKPKEVFHELRSAYVDDGRFAADFARKRFTNAAVARYVLAELNDALESTSGEKTTEQAGKITLEHVLPKNPGKDWGGAVPTGEEVESWTDRIGNLTLLEKGKNRGLANAGFSVKQQVYAKSSLSINRSLAQLGGWTTKEIEKRSDELANVAKSVWRLNY